MKEIIKIENFGGIKKMQLELGEINIIIGPQASGKSVSVKLMFFFKSFISEILKSVENGNDKRTLDKKQLERFKTFFPKESWPFKSFKIEYSIEDHFILIEKKQNKSLSFRYSESINKIRIKGHKIFKDEKAKTSKELQRAPFKTIRNLRSKFKEHVAKELYHNAMYDQFFVPAGRSFFANVQTSIFSFLSNNTSIDPFLIEFGSFYENFKNSQKELFTLKDNRSDVNDFDFLTSSIMNGSFKKEADKDYILHNDNRKVNLTNASSGQQEILPLILVLKTLSFAFPSKFGGTIYIEEPEAHLFPTAQKIIVQLLARTFNASNANFQIIITTHSPYILSSFNNLLQAGKIIDEKPNLMAEVHKVIPKKEVLHSKDLVAYSIFKGEKKDLLDKETKLISDNLLDSVSDQISKDFGELLDIEYS